MPILKTGERMQRCECEGHSYRRRQKYYIVRRYFNQLENHFCAGCLVYLKVIGVVNYTIKDGYRPIENTSTESILNIYGEGSQ